MSVNKLMLEAMEKEFPKEKERLTSILKEKGCTNVKIGYYENSFGLIIKGTFNSHSGEPYRFHASAHYAFGVLVFQTIADYENENYRAAKSVNSEREDLLKFQLK